MIQSVVGAKKALGAVIVFGAYIVLCGSPSMAAVNFDSPKTIFVGVSPSSIAVSDLNHDGCPDIVTVINAIESTAVPVLLGNCDGSFKAPVNYTVGFGPTAVVIGDFNSDGIDDLAVADENYYTESQNVSILLGKGDGTFGPATIFLVQDPSSLAIGDFNHDGNLDLVVTNSVTNSVSVLIGVGDGTFQSQVVYATGNFPKSVAVADLNKDGYQDFVVAAEDSNELDVFFGIGDGSFSTPVTYTTGRSPVSVAVGDFNGDGEPDISVVNYGSNNLSVFLGMSSGSLAPPIVYNLHPRPESLIVADLNKDGKPDLAIVEGSDQAEVLLGNGDGTFEPSIDLAPGGLAVGVGDFDRDGSPDLVLTPGAQVSVLRGNGTGNFQSVRNYLVGREPRAIASGDLNGDGVLDLVVGDTGASGAKNISILLGTSDGSFLPETYVDLPEIPYALALGDFNRDGRLDLAVSYSAPSPSKIYIYLGKGDGSFSHPIGYTSNSSYLFAIKPADINNDGRLDLIVSGQSGLTALLGKGDGTFQAEYSLEYPTITSHFVMADFNGDGNVDIAGASYPNDTVDILLGDGHGGFHQAADSYVFDYIEELTTGDYNGDGNADIGVAEYRGVHALLGNGAGRFQYAREGTEVFGTVDIQSADFDGDGKSDIVVSGHGPAVLISNGDGTFRSPVTFASGSGSEYIAVGDFNRDGRTDFAIVNGTSKSVSVLLNTTQK